jgi:putative Mg2+ transporter-C (MgtC) family protein
MSYHNSNNTNSSNNSGRSSPTDSSTGMIMRNNDYYMRQLYKEVEEKEKKKKRTRQWRRRPQHQHQHQQSINNNNNNNASNYSGEGFSLYDDSTPLVPSYASLHDSLLQHPQSMSMSKEDGGNYSFLGGVGARFQGRRGGMADQQQKQDEIWKKAVTEYKTQNDMNMDDENDNNNDNSDNDNNDNDNSKNSWNNDKHSEDLHNDNQHQDNRLVKNKIKTSLLSILSTLQNTFKYNQQQQPQVETEIEIEGKKIMKKRTNHHDLSQKVSCMILLFYCLLMTIGPHLLSTHMDQSHWCRLNSSTMSSVSNIVYENPDYNPNPCHYVRTPYLSFITIEECDLCTRMIISILFGGIIGYERRSSDRPAGIRTMGLVSLGSCFFTISSQIAFKSSTMGWDASRVTAAIPSGVGFLGAGLIWKGSVNSNDGGKGGRNSNGNGNGSIANVVQHQVHGLTTAASVWLSASIGVGCGGRLYVVSAYSMILVTMTLRYGPKLFMDYSREPVTASSTSFMNGANDTNAAADSHNDDHSDDHHSNDDKDHHNEDASENSSMVEDSSHNNNNNGERSVNEENRNRIPIDNHQNQNISDENNSISSNGISMHKYGTNETEEERITHNNAEGKKNANDLTMQMIQIDRDELALFRAWKTEQEQKQLQHQDLMKKDANMNSNELVSFDDDSRLSESDNDVISNRDNNDEISISSTSFE